MSPERFTDRRLSYISATVKLRESTGRAGGLPGLINQGLEGRSQALGRPYSSSKKHRPFLPLAECQDPLLVTGTTEKSALA
jgi:hypothetical protein